MENKTIEDQINYHESREKFELKPSWSEHEYSLISAIWKIFKLNLGTEGKKMAVDAMRKAEAEYRPKISNVWIPVKSRLPEEGEEVLIWIRYKDSNEFVWTDSYIENEDHVNKKYSYMEPNTKKYWSVGSAKGYEICGWMRIEKMWE
jgi:hypothetical protein